MIRTALIVTDHLPYISRMERVLTEHAGKDILITHSLTLADITDYPHKIYDVLFVDLNLINQMGLHHIYAIKQRLPDSYCIGMVLFSDDLLLLEGLSAGIDGFLQQADTLDKLRKDFQRILSGEPQISPSIARILLAHLPVAPHETTNLNTGNELTHHEVDTLRHIGKGSLLKQSAEALNISVETAQQHITSTYKKLRVQAHAGNINFSASLLHK